MDRCSHREEGEEGKRGIDSNWLADRLTESLRQIQIKRERKVKKESQREGEKMRATDILCRKK